MINFPREVSYQPLPRGFRSVIDFAFSSKRVVDSSYQHGSSSKIFVSFMDKTHPAYPFVTIEDGRGKLNNAFLKLIEEEVVNNGNKIIFYPGSYYIYDVLFDIRCGIVDANKYLDCEVKADVDHRWIPQLGIGSLSLQRQGDVIVIERREPEYVFSEVLGTDGFIEINLEPRRTIMYTHFFYDLLRRIVFHLEDGKNVRVKIGQLERVLNIDKAPWNKDSTESWVARDLFSGDALVNINRISRGAIDIKSITRQLDAYINLKDPFNSLVYFNFTKVNSESMIEVLPKNWLN